MQRCTKIGETSWWKSTLDVSVANTYVLADNIAPTAIEMIIGLNMEYHRNLGSDNRFSGLILTDLESPCWLFVLVVRV